MKRNNETEYDIETQTYKSMDAERRMNESNWTEKKSKIDNFLKDWITHF